MIVSDNHNLGGHLIIKNQRIEQVQKFSYLETIIKDDWDSPSLEIKCRIERAREAFRKMSKVFKRHDPSLGKKMLRCFVCITILWSRNWNTNRVNM